MSCRPDLWSCTPTSCVGQINEKPRWSRTSRARPASLCRTVTKKQRVGYARNCSRPNVSMPALVNALSMTPTSSAVRTARWVKLDRGLGRRDRRRCSEPTKRPAGDRRQTPVRKRPCRMWSDFVGSVDGAKRPLPAHNRGRLDGSPIIVGSATARTVGIDVRRVVHRRNVASLLPIRVAPVPGPARPLKLPIDSVVVDSNTVNAVVGPQIVTLIDVGRPPRIYDAIPRKSCRRACGRKWATVQPDGFASHPVCRYRRGV